MIPRANKFVDMYTELDQLGYQQWQIANKMGITITSLKRELNRYEIPVHPLTASIAAEQRMKDIDEN